MNNIFELRYEGTINGLKEYIRKNSFDCELCEDTGEISCDVMDRDGNWQRGVGSQICICILED
jgi:hypothetical protein